MDQDFPCIWGHSKLNHKYNERVKKFECWVKTVDRLKLPFEDDCLDFKLDNLRYLEQLSEY